MGKRKLIYIPEINETTFLFFFEKGNSGRSYSFRNYLQGKSPVVTYAESYPYTAGDIIARAKWCFDAPVHDTDDVDFWREETMSLNRKFLGLSGTDANEENRGAGRAESDHQGKGIIVAHRSTRVDNFGRAYAGSQLQIQIYVNRWQEHLSQCVRNSLLELASLKRRIRWVSPLEGEKFAEYQDENFLRAVGLDHYSRQLREFWPQGGPSWDALAAVDLEDGEDEHGGVLLVEAKSYWREVYGTGCQASSSESLRKIETALEQTKRWLGVSQKIAWTGRLYQSANRLAHLYFFREVVGIPAWLINVYFLNDPHSPTTHTEWQVALPQVKAELGLSSGVTIAHTAELFLEAGEPSELLRPLACEANRT